VWGSECTTKTDTQQGGSADINAWLKRDYCDLRGGAALPSGTAECNLEQQSEQKCASAAKKKCAILAVQPWALETGSR
jgi:hypothetical protein